MESKKFNWNKILSGLIAGIGIILVCLFIGICFFVPVNISAKALTKKDIKESNINFVSAKTKIKSAENLERVKLQNFSGNDFYSYQYKYNGNVNTTPLYYTSNNSNALGSFSSGLGNANLTSGNQILKIYENYSSDKVARSEFIPSNVTSFKNEITGSIEDIFYDEADENDFVMLNNYYSYASTYNGSVQPFNVENFYLGFGTPYVDELESNHTTPINTLSVEGILYSKGKKHNLVLNEPQYAVMDRGLSSYYWHQYFDLNSLEAYKDNLGQEDSRYTIEDQQGKYQITFRFIKYSLNTDGNWEVLDNTEQTFTYTFYLLDSANYDSIPTIKNATLGAISNNNASEYFYNFTNDYPYITYDPQKFNLSYTRENKEIYENITSNFAIGTYTFNSRNYPKGILSFTDGTNNKKQVLMLAYYNEEGTLAEYLYLSNKTKNAISIPNNYDDILRLINNKSLDFEYKITIKLNKTIDGGITKYTWYKYFTYDYEKLAFSTNTNNYDTNKVSTEYVRVDGNNYYYSANGTSEEKIAEISVVDDNIITNLYVSNNLNNTTNNTKILNKLNNLEKLNVNIDNVDFEYNLVLEDLGIYTCKYNYNCAVFANEYNKDIITNTSNNSTNILGIKDIVQSYTKITPATTPTPETKDVTLNTWTYLNVDNKGTLNNIEYTYNPRTNKLTFNDGNDVEVDVSGIANNRTAILGNARVDATYKVDTDALGQYYLTISYKIADISTTKYQTKYLSTKENEEYVTNYENKETNIISLVADKNQTDQTLSSALISNNNNTELLGNWQNVINVIKYFENTEHNNYSTINYSTTSPDTSSDILHIFGSMSYFNKNDVNAIDTTSNNGKSKLSQIDSRLKTNYVSDITKYVKSARGYYNKSFDANKDLKNITDGGVTGITNVAIKNGLDVNNIIITDITPVFWKNLSSLLYDGKVSKSYIYRYNNYKIENGYINYGANCVTNLYTKDTYCHQDGLYEIVVLYKYDGFKSLDSDYDYNNTLFYQVFTFIIDNSSPKMEIKVQDVNDVDMDGDTTEYITPLGLNKYTNKNIEISWKIPTYFQNDVYIDIERLSFSNAKEFKAIYKQGNVTYDYDNSGVARTTTSFKEPKLYDSRYYVYITSDNAPCNGNYRVTLHYSSKGNSTSTEEFVIDKQNIDGMEVLPAVQNANGTYSTNLDNQNYTAGKQIINYNFTFRYNQKASKAKIYTYWYKIDLVSTSDYDKLLNVNSDESAITTTFKVDGKNVDSNNYGNQYIYNYNKDQTVLNANYFTSSSSCIYLFKMVDEAGNECRYVVFYDTTNPRFLLDPAPKNNIINDTTQLIWGNYKAIKIETPTGFTFDNGKILNHYTKDTTISNNLEEALTYINSSNASYPTTSNFNDTKIQAINGDLYMLLPISAVTIKDISTSTINTSGSTTSISFDKDSLPNNYYFFPTNPLNNEQTQINIGSYYSPNLKDITGYEITKAINSKLESFDRFIYATDTNTNYYGTIGEGEFSYIIFDGQRNKGEGYVWMTLDKTQTSAYAIFDTKTPDDPSKATMVTGKEGTYALSKLYISSLEANESAKIPDYTLTYRFYELNDNLYENLNDNYEIYTVHILNKDSTDIPNKITITDKQTYLQLTYRSKTNYSDYLHYYIELTNEDGEPAANHSYPYDIEGVPGEPDSSGNRHVYDVNKSTYSIREDSDNLRIFSKIINPTPDTNGKTETVTQEGLYIFKRMYTNPNIDLGLDTRIVYYLYYVDRTGIINVTTLNSISKQLMSDKQDFGFVLGSDYKEENLKKYINSDALTNAQSAKDVNSYTSNTYNTISNLFTTNKILVQFNLTADKYNFSAFTNKFEDQIQNKIANISGLTVEQIEALQTSTKAFLFNNAYYSNNLYKINLTLAKGNVNIINESETDTTKIYNTKAINSYLKGSYSTSGNRDNSFNLFLQDSNSNAYNIYLRDNCGYRIIDKDGVNNNYNANELDISFYIKHNAPTGDSYGKYYGRHDYDEDKNSGHSIPIKEYVDEDGNIQTTYALLEKYLQNGQLEPLSLNYKEERMNGSEGRYVKLYSTNNESLIFTFDITQDDTQAQIDPNNIKIYKDSINESNLIFNRQNGINIDTALVSASRMTTSIFTNVINGVTKYAIVVFDNNLDEILNDDEKSYSNYRLLDSKDNPDGENYYIQINYVGDKDNYIQEDNNGNRISYYSTTFEVTVDRNKPEYNLTKLMSLDKYVYNTALTTPNSTNYESVFNSYKKFYNFQSDEDFNFERSDLENYFFALDYRKDSSFVFESISELDSNGGIFIRNVSGTNYRFSKTPDDYKSYYEATYLPGNPQFSPSRATTLTKMSNTKITDSSVYYYIAYGAMSDDPNDNTLKAYDLMQFLEVNNYYEIIEQDEAGNYRVYAIYLPDYQNTQIRFEYKENTNSDVKTGSLNYNSNPTIPNISGIDFNLTYYKTSDYFVKANLTIDSTNLKETISIYYSLKDSTIYVKTSENLIREKFENISIDEYNTKFIEVINNQIKLYNDMVSSKSSNYYTQYGYVINLAMIDRLGIKSTISETRLFDYEFTYNVAGSILEPTFRNNSNNFNMIIPAMQGTTYIEQVSASIFQGGWSPKDPDDMSNSFSKTASELKKGTTYTLNKGVYKFVITDNFKRTNTYFYEFGSNSQSGGLLNFSDKYVAHTDGYTYTAKSANFVYDNSIYDIYIKFVGESGENTYLDSDVSPHIVYSSNKSYSANDLRQYGIAVATIDNITTISFYGVTDLTKYHIKTIPASISSQYEYTWGAEKDNDNFLVYDRKLAIYTGIQQPIIRNSNGNILDTSEHLNLSEDFEVTTAWTNGYLPEKQISFDSKIYLERTYTENNVVRTERFDNADTYAITKQGEYTAYVFNALNNKSEAISFSRGDNEIGIYSVLNVQNKSSQKLNPSAKVTSDNYETEDENRTLIEFNYFTTIDFFSFKDASTNTIIEPSTLVGKDEEDLFTSIENVQINRNNSKYMDVQVKSDLSIFVQIYELKKDGDTPYAKFRIYSKNKENKDYTYRFVKVYFLDDSNYTLANVLVSNVVSSINEAGSKNNNIYDNSAVIKRPDKTLYVAFKFKDATNSTKYIDGNTIFVERYFNGELVETLTYTTITELTEAKFTLTQVGLHKFIIKDLAGRQQIFGSDTTSADNLQIYLINQILFEVNGETPINNQIFNGDVNIKIKSELAGVTLYNTNTLGVKVTRNGEEIGVTDNGELTFSEPGSYVVKIDATTVLADQEISTTYKFVIVKTNIANKSFNISKGTGFEIDKVYKIVNNERLEMTENFKNGNIGEEVNSGSLIWLTADNQGNSIFEISLKYYNQTMKEYQYFTFNVWLNNDQPVIISSIANGAATKDAITLSFNPGIIYSQVGRCKILINDREYLEINDESGRAVETITITQKGTYTIKIVSEDGTLISSYKYTKNDPISNTTKIVIICVVIFVVVLVVLFLLIRRKGKYR